MESSQYWAVPLSPFILSSHMAHTTPFSLTSIQPSSLQPSVHVWHLQPPPQAKTWGWGGGENAGEQRVAQAESVHNPPTSTILQPPSLQPPTHVHDTSSPPLKSWWWVMGGRCGCLGCKRRPNWDHHATPHHQQHCNLTPTTLCIMYIPNPPLKSKWWVLGGWYECLGCKRRPRQTNTTAQHQQHCNLST